MPLQRLPELAPGPPWPQRTPAWCTSIRGAGHDCVYAG